MTKNGDGKIQKNGLRLFLNEAKIANISHCVESKGKKKRKRKQYNLAAVANFFNSSYVTTETFSCATEAALFFQNEKFNFFANEKRPGPSAVQWCYTVRVPISFSCHKPLGNMAWLDLLGRKWWTKKMYSGFSCSTYYGSKKDIQVFIAIEIKMKAIFHSE